MLTAADQLRTIIAVEGLNRSTRAPLSAAMRKRSGQNMIGTARLLKQMVPGAAKKASRPIFRMWGRTTSPLRTLPDFLIIGTKRGGTTSLFKYLQLHPGVLPMWPVVENAKKTYYFDRNYEKGTGWYRAHFPSQRHKARVANQCGGLAITGEAAPYYMFHPHVMHRVANDLPNVKVLVLLRNPVDRVWSHYHERVQAGTEHLPFRMALEEGDRLLEVEARRLLNEPYHYSENHDFRSYLARGRYLEHLEPWLDDFPSEQLHVVRSEDLYTNPQETLRNVHQFLGLERLLPAAPHRYNRVSAPTIDPDVREWLIDYYRPHVQALESRLNRPFNWGL